jgi:hypothetical protein
MKIARLIETVREVDVSPEDCAHHLLAESAGWARPDAERAFRTALAVAALDMSRGRRLATALAGFATSPLASGPPSLVTAVAALEERCMKLRSGRGSAHALAEKIEGIGRHLETTELQIAELTAAVEEARRRCAEKTALLQEVRHEP